MGRFSIAGLAVILAICWQYITVSVNYNGNWSALFCTGSYHRLPPQLDSELVYTFENSHGFDGQFYHFIAHEPWPNDLAAYVEGAQMRYRRILLPGLAYLLSLGRHSVVDFTYMSTGYFFLFLGLLWSGSYAIRLGLSPYWTLLFAAVPASPIFVDRLTVDHLLAAFCAGFALHAVRQPSWQLYLILVLAPLARETGLLLTVAYCLYCVLWKHWRLTAIFATSTIPWALWTAYLAMQLGGASYATSLVPLEGLFRNLLNPVDYPADIPYQGLIHAADIAALLGMLLAICLAGMLWIRQRSDPVAIAALLYALLTIFVQRGDVWMTVYNYGRIFSPLLLLVALGWMPRNRWLAAAPLLLVVPRVLIQYGRQVEGIARAIVG